MEQRSERERPEHRPKPLVVIDHLSGFHRGSRQILAEEDLEIGTAREATIHFPADHEPAVAPHHARIQRKNGMFELQTIGRASVRVNGNPVEAHVLASGDLIVVGEHGPVIKFRTQADPKKRFKSIPEALADCRDTARVEKSTLAGRVWSFLKQAPDEMLRQTAPWTRVTLFVTITLLLFATFYLALVSSRLQRDLREQEAILTVVQEERGAITNGELERLREALENRLTEAIQRVEVLEHMSEAGKHIVRSSSGSIAFLIGEYGFVDPAGQPLRTVLGSDGQVLLNRKGSPAVSPEGTGPPFVSEFTGTGFLVTEDGRLLTNRHVVLPWEFDAGAQAVISTGYRPVMNYLAGFLPQNPKAFRLSLVASSDSVDLALLACEEDHEHAKPLPMSDAEVTAGDEVFVMGYPTGIRALLARTDVRFVTRLLEETKRDFKTIVQRLAEDDRIAPLATSGIVGQVTPTYVVYDAETTHGGSGGPVIGRDGQVVAINAAILNDFGGSNLGIPVRWAKQLLEEQTR